MSKVINIGIVEDHKIVRKGIWLMLFPNPNMNIIWEASNATEFWFQLEKERPDVLLMDINLPQMTGLEITRKLLREYKNPPHVIFLTGNVGQDYVKQAIKAGGKGFLSKDCTEKEMLEAIETVCNGQMFFEADITQQILLEYRAQIENSDQSLSERELIILAEFANGLSYKQIAEKQNISVKTVEAHRKSIFTKMNFENQADLIKYAIKNHMV